MDDVQVRGLTLLGLSLGIIALASWLIYRRMGRVAPSDVMMPFLEHVEELRVRILRSGLVVLLWMLMFLSVHATPFTVYGIRLAYPQFDMYHNMAAQVYLGLVQVAVPPNVTLIVSSPTEAVGAQLQIALLLSVSVALPFLLYEAWAFASPALASREQRFVRAVLPLSLVLFFTGAAFGFFIVVPTVFAILYAFATPLGAAPLLSAGALVGSVVTTSFLFGAAFELPLLMAAAVRLGLTSTRAYLRRWRHATIGIFIVAAIATDPTLVSQLMVGGILLALFWGGVLASWIIESRSPWTQRASAKTT